MEKPRNVLFDTMPSEPADDVRRSFSELLRARRLARGLTQAELAAKAGIGVRTLRDLERSGVKPQRATAELLTAALGLRGSERNEFIAAGRGWSAASPPVTVSSGLDAVALPPPPDLIGRDWDLVQVAELLDSAPVVTLVGVAGVGKTSLAWASAHRLAERYPGGARGVSISEVSTEQDILSMIAAVFGVPRVGELPRAFAGRPALLFVDATERSIGPAAAALSSVLAATAPTLRVLATGRRPLDLPGERAWPVAPLEAPPPGERDLQQLLRYPSVQLFLDRVRAVRGRAALTEAEAAVLGELVRRLGGLPLALELAAGRARILELEEILDRYGHRVLDLTTAPEDGASETLRDAVAESYQLLSPADQHALRRLSIFRHRWSIELAEPMLVDLVEGGRRPAAVDDVVLLLDRLVGLGLVSVRGAGPMRFRLLDVVRDFGREQCAAAGELADVQRRHAEVITTAVARAAPDLAGAAMPTAVTRLDDLASDVRAALVVAAADAPDLALELASRLPRWWRFRGYDREGRQWLQRLLDDPRTADADAKTRAWAQLGVAQLAAEHGERVGELRTAESALAAFTQAGSIDGELAAHTLLCALHFAIGGYDEARRHTQTALSLATRHGRRRDVLVAQTNLTWHDIRVGDLVAARRRLTSVQRLAAELGDQRLRALAQANLAEVARLDGRYAEAAATGRRTLRLLEDLGDPGHRRRVQATIALALALGGHHEDAEELLPELDEGASMLVDGYLALGRGDRMLAAGRFAAAADVLDGQHDVRDVVEALAGQVSSLDDPVRRKQVSAQLTAVCERTGTALLPVELERLGGL